MSKELKTKFKKAGVSVIKAGADIISFSDTNINRIEILTCKDGQRNVNGKLKKSYDMKVKDLNDNDKEKEFNPVSTRLLELLSDIDQDEGLIGQKLRIEAIGQGTKRHYKVEKITD